uniref:Uncharacterized protein n=1 Tax=Oryza meridionalis TaxID=40149 RepID=A0A0E0C1Y0_9ORYZ
MLRLWTASPAAPWTPTLLDLAAGSCVAPLPLLPIRADDTTIYQTMLDQWILHRVIPHKMAMERFSRRPW